MDDSVGVYLRVAIADLFEEIDCFAFGQSSARGDHVGEVTTLAKFSNNVSVVFGGIDLINFYNIVGLFEGLEDLYFRREKVFMHLSL